MYKNIIHKEVFGKNSAQNIEKKKSCAISKSCVASECTERANAQRSCGAVATTNEF